MTHYMNVVSDFAFTVTGSWPFPLDMLRRDDAIPASPEDQAKIAALSQEYAPDRDSLRERVSVNLIMPNVERRRRPCTARWESFGWSVPGDQDRVDIKNEAKRARARPALVASALAKLTPEEREALEWVAGRSLSL